VTLTINADAGDTEAPDDSDSPELIVVTEVADPDRRRRQVDELLYELTAWNPRARMGAFRRWLRSPFSLIHLGVVSILDAAGPLPMSRLAASLGVSVASATGIVDRMESRGLVERRHSEDDRRVIVVHLTDAGEELFRKVERQRRKHLAGLMERLSDEEVDAFLFGLRALHRARVAEAGDAPDDDQEDEEPPS
jgi:DNA-binding MarR family transcriptional regulator